MGFALGGAGILGLVAVHALTRPSVEDLRAEARARGGLLHHGAVERGWLGDVVRDVRVELPDGLELHATELELSRRAFAAPALRAPELRATLRADPTGALRSLSRLAPVPGPGLSVGRLSAAYRHRTLGELALDGLTVHGAAPVGSFTAERARFLGVRFDEPVFSVKARKSGVVEVLLGSGPRALPRASALYVPNAGRAAEWRVDIPHQPLAELAAAVGVRVGESAPPTRVGGTFSWVMPDSLSIAPRGTVRFVLDRWYQPPWPEASALTGSSGSLSATILPSEADGGFRLERVEVGAALFHLEGSGTLELAHTLRVKFAASGRRTCAQLSEHLPPSRYRDTVRRHVARSGAPKGQPPRAPLDAGPSGHVDLTLRVELSLGPNGHLRFHWHLTPGCGLTELTATTP